MINAIGYDREAIEREALATSLRYRFMAQEHTKERYRLHKRKKLLEALLRVIEKLEKQE